MDDFAHIQTGMQASIDSQTGMMHDLFGHIGINPDAIDLSMGEAPDAQVRVHTYLVSFSAFLVISSLVLPVSLPSSWL
jgi:hypothetical protein